MKRWQKYCAGLAITAGLTPGAKAQAPAIPAAPALPAAAAGPSFLAPGVAAPAAVPQNTLWSFLGISIPQKQACRDWICQSPCGQLLNNGLAPVSFISGGLFPGFCPPVTAADLAKPGAEGVAAQIKADTADAKARRAALRYLGTVDCHYWPEAQDALIAGLRTDRNECVRWEAALALQRGCCCTKKVIEALVITVSSSEKDGNPSETSDRVKAATEVALYHCLDCYSQTVAAAPAPPAPPEGPRPLPPPAPEGPRPAAQGGAPAELPIKLSAYYRRLESKSMNQVVSEARQALAKSQSAAEAARAALPISAMPTGSRDIHHILENAVFGGRTVVTQTATGEPAAAPVETKTVQPALFTPKQQAAPAAAPAHPTFAPAAATPTPAAPAKAAGGYAPVTPVLAPTVAPATPAKAPAHVPLTSAQSPKATPYTPVMPIANPMSAAAQSQPVATDKDQVWTPTPTTAPRRERLRSVSAPTPYSVIESRSGADTMSFTPVRTTLPAVERTTALTPIVLPAASTTPTTTALDPMPAPAKHPEPSTTRLPVIITTTQTATPSPACTVVPAPAPQQTVHPPRMPVAAAATDLPTSPRVPSPPATPPVPESRVYQPRAPEVRTTAALATMTPAAMPASYTAPVAPTRMATPPAAQLLAVLQEAVNPFQREWAAHMLGEIDPQAHPEVVPALTAAAHTDKAATVRVQCVRSLARNRVQTPAVMAVIRDLRTDRDPRVQHEANVALGQLRGPSRAN
jgi:hypothetical protein